MPVLVVLFLAVPFAELAVLIAVGSRIGVGETILLMLAISVAGAFLARRAGLGVLRDVQRRVAQGEVPGRELLDGLLVLVAGALLLTPGFLTDALALVLLLPFVRGAVRAALRRRFEHRISVYGSATGGWGGRVVDVEPPSERRARPPRELDDDHG